MQADTHRMRGEEELLKGGIF